MTIIVNQPFGTGDAIFSMTAIKSMYKHCKIIWPVEPFYVEGLNRAYPDIIFIDRNLININYEERAFISGYDTLQVPLRYSQQICKVLYKDCMKSKYQMFELDWEKWKLHAKWARNANKEINLSKEVGLTWDQMKEGNFALVSRAFNNNFSGKANFKVETELPIIEMRAIEGYSLFDWAYIMERAGEIHTVSSSIIYCLEMINLKAQVINIHIREVQEVNHDNYSYILTSHNYTLK